MKLEGFAELDAQLRALANPETAYQIGLSAVMGCAELLQKAWVAGAPFDPALKGAAAQYGHARDNIRIGPVKAQKVNAVVYKVSTGDAFWLRFYEFGTVKQPARPTFRPIVERMKSEFIDLQIEAVNEGIAKAVAGKGGAVLAARTNG